MHEQILFGDVRTHIGCSTRQSIAMRFLCLFVHGLTVWKYPIKIVSHVTSRREIPPGTGKSC